MKKEEKIVLGAAALAVAVYAGGTAVAGDIANNISLSVGNVALDWNSIPRTLQPLNPNQIYVGLRLPLIIENRNPIPLGFDQFVGEITYGQIKLASVQLPKGIWLPANKTHTEPLEIAIPVKQVLDDVNLLLGGGFAGITNALRNRVILNGSVSLLQEIGGGGVSVRIPSVTIL